MKQQEFNDIFMEFIEQETGLFVVMASDSKFSVYSEKLDKIAIIDYDKELDYELADCFLHNALSILGKDVKNTLRFLHDNKVLTGADDITINLYDIDIIQHIIDENHTFELNEMDELAKSKEILHAFNLRKGLLSQDEKVLYKNIEARLIKTLLAMEIAGIGVDKNELEIMGEEVENQIIKVGGRLSATFGSSALNLNSPKQLSELFFNVMKIPVKEEWRTKTGAVSTAAHVIEEIAKENPHVKEILDYRELAKIKGTYIDSLIKKIVNGKIHASFNQIGTVTGRLSSSNPNLQNQPNNEKYDIRGAFKAREGYSFIDADYSQIEIRILASMSGDETLINAYKDGRDIHQETADKLGITRSQAKGINFGIIYGMSSFGFAEAMQVSNDEAKIFIQKYFNAFPKVKDFIRETKELLTKNGYGETLFGRRRHFIDYQKADFAEKNRIERQVVNARIQGTAADIMKVALNKIHSRIIDKFDAKILITVHDEVIVEVNDVQLEEVMAIVKYEMESVGAGRIVVPLEVEINHSKKWIK